MFTVNRLAIAMTALALAACGSDDGDNGAQGIVGGDGKNGFNSLVNQVMLEIGHEECRNGGLRIDSGLDSNESGTLTNDEVNHSEYVCAEPVSRLPATAMLNNLNNAWYMEAQQKIENNKLNSQTINTLRGSAKNVILFVGDGMGLSTVTAARILEGQDKGLLGEENTLSFGTFPFAGLVKTYNVDAQTPDSAGTMTAMISGVKTDKGVLGVDEDVIPGDCASATGNELVTALEMAEIAGMSTGIISTARITHATPAASYAKSALRGWEDNADMDQASIDAGCEDIASQLVNFESNLEGRYPGVNVDGIEIVMGGGRRNFLPNETQYNVEKSAEQGAEGDRSDGRHLINEWKGIYNQGTYVDDTAGFNAIDVNTTEPIFALFNESHMQYEADRGNDILGEPSLTEMTQKAIDVLNNNEKGFFLTIESGRVDHAHHAGNAYNALQDTIELSRAVQVAMDKTDAADTLIIVTADHSHVLTIGGYPKRGNPILGKVIKVGEHTPALANDDLPYTTLSYANGAGFQDLGDETDADEGDGVYIGRADLSAVDTQTPGYHQEAVVPLGGETHAGEDVSVYASGPGAHLVNGTNEQSYIFHVMEYAADLEGKADKVLANNL